MLPDTPPVTGPAMPPVLPAMLRQRPGNRWSAILGMTGLLLAISEGPLHADPVLVFSPAGCGQPGTGPSPGPHGTPRSWSECLPQATADRDEAFSRLRWPCIIRGMLWAQRQGRSSPPLPAEQLIPVLKEAFAAAGLPPELAWVAEVESTLNPQATSKSGARGLFQFKPDTARRFDLLTDQGDHRAKPEESARAAARYLAQLHSRFGDWTLAIAAYNAGEGCVSRLLKARQASLYEEIADGLPDQTQVYVIKVTAILALREGVRPGALPPPRLTPSGS